MPAERKALAWRCRPVARTWNTLLSNRLSVRIDRENAKAMLKSENDRPISDCATLQPADRSAALID